MISVFEIMDIRLHTHLADVVTSETPFSRIKYHMRVNLQWKVNDRLRFGRFSLSPCNLIDTFSHMPNLDESYKNRTTLTK